VVISAQSVGMLIFIPIMGVLADRFGAHRLVIVNVLLGVLANIGFMIAGNEAVLIVATLLNAAMWATLGGIGITVAQDLYPTGIGLASSLYFSAIRFAAAIGGIAGALGVRWFGVPGVFAVPAALCVLAAVGLLVQEVLTQRRSRRRPGAPEHAASSPRPHSPAAPRTTSPTSRRRRARRPR
jgi:SET family sugar efflux transporter-like MFS transporter